MISFSYSAKYIAFSVGEVAGDLETARGALCAGSRGHVSPSARGSFLQLTLEPPFRRRAWKVDY